uniref:G_PROTEIN_RECEP_F3_4 domain-containing protein n=1 Tax=Macrostomum lignano TaxID=282301 RepID=A0A1I8I453_9PLAT
YSPEKVFSNGGSEAAIRSSKSATFHSRSDGQASKCRRTWLGFEFGSVLVESSTRKIIWQRPEPLARLATEQPLCMQAVVHSISERTPFTFSSKLLVPLSMSTESVRVSSAWFTFESALVAGNRISVRLHGAAAPIPRQQQKGSREWRPGRMRVGHGAGAGVELTSLKCGQKTVQKARAAETGMKMLDLNSRCWTVVCVCIVTALSSVGSLSRMQSVRVFEADGLNNGLLTDISSLSKMDSVRSVYIVALVSEQSQILTDKLQEALRMAGPLTGGISVRLVIADTECVASRTIRYLFNLLHQLPSAIAILGCGCPELTGPISQISYYWNITMASANLSDLLESQGFDMSNVLSGRFTSMETAVEAMETIKNNFCIRQRNETIGGSVMCVVVSRTLLTTRLNPCQGFLQKRLLSEHFRKAHRIGLIGKQHVWLVSGLRQLNQQSLLSQLSCNSDIGASNASVQCDCEKRQLDLAANRSLFISLAGRRASQLASRGVPSEVAYAIDSVSAVAMAAGGLIDQINLSESYRVKDGGLTPKMLKRLRSLELMKKLVELKFDGETGKVEFAKNSRLGYLSVYQLIAPPNGSQAELRFVSEFNCAKRQFKELEEYNAWPEDWPPRDRTQVEVRVVRLPLWLCLTFSGLAAAGIALSVALMGSYIKMSSPQMNNIIVLGCIVCYASVILLATDGWHLTGTGNSSGALQPGICAARAWTLCTGFTLSFGAMFSKTWRVHCIFTNISMSKKIIKDYQLLVIVLLLLLIDIAILTVWTAFDPMTSKKHLFSIELIGCFFAWETRNVSVPALNDSKYIGLSVYNALVMCLAGAAVSFALNNKQTAAFVITSLLILCCTSITLLLLFSPKSIAELEKAEARMAALRTGSHHKSSQSSVEIRHRWLQFASSLPPFEYIDASERETTMEEEQVWIPRTDSPATARRQRRRLRLVLSVDDGPSTSEVDSFEQHIADVQERLLAAEPRLASPDPETTELDCEDTSEINEHQDPSTISAGTIIPAADISRSSSSICSIPRLNKLVVSSKQHRDKHDQRNNSSLTATSDNVDRQCLHHCQSSRRTGRFELLSMTAAPVSAAEVMVASCSERSKLRNLVHRRSDPAQACLAEWTVADSTLLILTKLVAEAVLVVLRQELEVLALNNAAVGKVSPNRAHHGQLQLRLMQVPVAVVDEPTALQQNRRHAILIRNASQHAKRFKPGNVEGLMRLQVEQEALHLEGVLRVAVDGRVSIGVEVPQRRGEQHAAVVGVRQQQQPGRPHRAVPASQRHPGRFVDVFFAGSAFLVLLIIAAPLPGTPSNAATGGGFRNAGDASVMRRRKQNSTMDALGSDEVSSAAPAGFSRSERLRQEGSVTISLPVVQEAGSARARQLTRLPSIWMQQPMEVNSRPSTRESGLDLTAPSLAACSRSSSSCLFILVLRPNRIRSSSLGGDAGSSVPESPHHQAARVPSAIVQQHRQPPPKLPQPLSAPPCQPLASDCAIDAAEWFAGVRTADHQQRWHLRRQDWKLPDLLERGSGQGHVIAWPVGQRSQAGGAESWRVAAALQHHGTVAADWDSQGALQLFLRLFLVRRRRCAG